MSKWRDKLEQKCFFREEEPYDYGVEVQKMLESDLERSLLFPEDAGLLAQVVHNGNHSDHVEIGTFYGGSAILAALVKKKFRMHGHVYCVDPLECRPADIKDGITNDKATTKAVMENAARFGVEDRIVIVPKMSHPWPLEGKSFGTGYIDGDHWNGMPTKDWRSLRKCVEYAIVFDDYLQDKPEVVRAVHIAIQDPEWLLIRLSGSHAVLRRRQ